MMTQQVANPQPPAPSRESVVTTAALRAASRLAISNKTLGRIIGVSEATVSRMGAGTYTLSASEKPYELAVLFIRLFRSLDTMLGGDERAALVWLKSENLALGAAPLALIQS